MDFGRFQTTDDARMNQDRIVTSTQQSPLKFALVADGHGNDACVQYVADAIPRLVAEAAVRGFSPRQALEYAFQTCHVEFDRDVNESRAKSGAVAIAALVNNYVVTLANAGDCRCVMSAKDGCVVQVTVDHNAESIHERNRVESLGGRVAFVRGVWRVSGRLSPTRAFGDLSVRIREDGAILDCIRPVPDMFEFQPEPTDADGFRFAVLGSDGLFDKMTNDEIGELVQQGLRTNLTAQAISRALVSHASKRTNDDVSCVVLVWPNERPAPNQIDALDLY